LHKNRYLDWNYVVNLTKGLAMIIQFVVRNILSFSDEEDTVFKMTATKDDRHPNHVVDIQEQGLQVLRTAAVYGANGAGKTNLVKALSFLKRLVTKGIGPKKKIPINRFRLKEQSAKNPAKFVIDFLQNNVHYSYGIVLDDSSVLEEWLYCTKPNGRETKLFERTTDENGEPNIDFGAQLKKESGEDFLEFLAKGTRKEQPFISEAESRNLKQTQPVIDWFREKLAIISVEPIYRPLQVRLHEDKNFADDLGKFLKAAGTGIESVVTKSEELDFKRHLPDMPESTRQEILNDLNGKINVVIGGQRLDDEFLVIRGTREKPEILKLQTVHKSTNGESVTFSFSEESSGTKKLMHLFPALISLTQEDKVYVIDELDRSMHPLLSRAFLKTFLQADNKKSQLIFTTHEECLLDLDIIRRDEVWFVQKDENTNASKCYPLTDYKVRPDLEIRKGYLNGRFGAIPFFSDAKQLGWA
jgi:AAA15 family ATPase/GTPase